MLSTSRNIRSVLRRMVDGSAEVRCVNSELRLSPFLSGAFNLYRADVLDTRVLFAEDVSGEEGLSNRLGMLAKALGEPVALVTPSVTSSEKRALIAARQGFVTEQGDMYLPQLALALNARAEKKHVETRSLSPSQQQAFLYCLLGDGELTQEGLREKTGMSAAGASRALSLLADARLIDYEIGGKTGRKRTYFVPDTWELFCRGKKLFGDPVTSVARCLVPSAGINLNGDFLVSGLSALALRSELVAPASLIVATGPKTDLSEAFRQEFSVNDGTDSAITVLIQKLSYDPRPFAEEGVVDPFTMLATIDEEDERISIALRQALGGFSWYTG